MNTFRQFVLYVFAVTSLFHTCFSKNATAADKLPTVKITSVRKLFHNGEHNAFTDMIKFQGKYYLTFRSCPDGHMLHPTSKVLVLVSEDTKTWKPIHQFSVAKRDVRDPHFLVFKKKLFIYTGTWYCGETSPKTRDINQHLGYGVWTADGKKWSKPIMLEGTYGHYIWRAASFGGTAYLCGRRKREFAEVKERTARNKILETAMLESEDGLIWKTRSLFTPDHGDETAFLFEPDGALLAIGRSGSLPAWVFRSQPPYHKMERVQLDRYLGGPLLVKWNRRYVVGGRKAGKHAKDRKPVTSLYWLKDNQLHEFATLPSGGDNSYPGFLEISPTRALVSYYSSHEKDKAGKIITAIYMAEIEIVE